VCACRYRAAWAGAIQISDMGSLTTLLRRTAWRPQTIGESQRQASHARRLGLPSARRLLEGRRLHAEDGRWLRACMSGVCTAPPHRHMSRRGPRRRARRSLMLATKKGQTPAATVTGGWSVVLNAMTRPAARLLRAQCLHQRCRIVAFHTNAFARRRRIHATEQLSRARQKQPCVRVIALQVCQQETSEPKERLRDPTVMENLDFGLRTSNAVVARNAYARHSGPSVDCTPTMPLSSTTQSSLPTPWWT
jgi:hypothetical protein